MEQRTFYLSFLLSVFSFNVYAQDYTIQLGAFKDQANAVAVQKKLFLEHQGNSFISQNSDGLFMLRVGVFSSSEQASVVASLLKSQGFDVYVRSFIKSLNNAPVEKKSPDVAIIHTAQAHVQKTAAVTAIESIASASKKSDESIKAPNPITSYQQFEITGFAVDGNSLLTSEVVQNTLSPFVGANKSFADVQKALDALQQQYVTRDFNAVRVMLPEQNLSAGSILLHVVEGRITNVVVEGAEYHDDANIIQSLPSIAIGETPRLNQITSSLKLANENPSKNTTVLMRNAGKPGELEAVVKVKDKTTMTAFTTLDNTGTPTTGESRFTAGFQDANLTNNDDVIRVQASTSVAYPERYKTIMGSYHIPIFKTGGSIDTYVGLSDANSGNLAGGLVSIAGAGKIVGVRYNQLIAAKGDTTHSVFAGMEQKEFRTSLNVAGVSVDGSVIGSPDIDALPINVGYKGTWQGQSSQAGWYGSYSQNVGGSRKAVYESLGSTSDYGLIRYGADYMQSLSLDWRMRLRVLGQHANQHLIAGEQFAIGGMDNLRGLYERSFAADSAMLMTGEIYTPDVGSSLIANSTLRGLLFVDRLSAKHELTGATASDFTSAGLGVRFGYANNLTLRADVATLVDVPKGMTQKNGDTYAHVGVSVAY